MSVWALVILLECSSPSRLCVEIASLTKTERACERAIDRVEKEIVTLLCIEVRAERGRG